MQHDALVTEPENTAVAGKTSGTRPESFLSFLKAGFRRDSDMTILGVDVVQPIQRVGEELLGRESENRFGSVGLRNATVRQRPIPRYR